MRHYLTLFTVFSVLFLSIDVDARRGGGSFGGGRSSSSRSSSSRYTAPKSTSRKTTSIFSKKTTSKSNNTAVSEAAKKKQKAVATSSLSKKVQKKNAAAVQKYGKGKEGRKKAAADFKQSQEWKNKSSELASKKYDSPNPPSNRPKYVPNDVEVGGRSVNVTYNALPGGGYGYGYMDPMTHTFMALQASHMMVTDAMLMSHGYGTYGMYANRQMVPTDPEAQRMQQENNRIGLIVMWVFIGGLLLVVVIVIVKNSM